MSFVLRNILLAIAGILLAIGGWFAYLGLRYERPQDATRTLIETKADFRKAGELANAGDLDQAIELYSAMLDDTRKTDEKAVIELRIAMAEFKKDWKAGVPLLKKVGMNESHPAITRAYAFQYLFWTQRATGSRELLSLILSGKPFESVVSGLSTERARLLAANQYVSSIYPLGITEMYIASSILRNIAAQYDDPYPLNEEAKRKHEGDIERVKIALQNNDSYMDTIKQGTASYLYPDALVSKANILARMERLGLFDPMLGEPERIYKEVLSSETLAYVHNDPDMEVYYLYYYASYLRRLANRTIDVKTTLERMTTLAKDSEEFKTFIKNNSSESSGERANLVALASYSAPLKQLLNQLGWSLK